MSKSDKIIEIIDRINPEHTLERENKKFLNLAVIEGEEGLGNKFQVLFASGTQGPSSEVFLLLNDNSWVGFENRVQLGETLELIPELIGDIDALDGQRFPLQTDSGSHAQINLMPSPGSEGWSIILDTSRPLISSRKAGNAASGYSHRLWSGNSLAEVRDILQTLGHLSLQPSDATRLLEVDDRFRSFLPAFIYKPKRAWLSDPVVAQTIQNEVPVLFERFDEWLGTPQPPAIIMHLYNWVIRSGIQIAYNWLCGQKETQNWCMHLSVNEASGVATADDLAHLYGYDPEIVQVLINFVRLTMHADMHKTQVQMSMWGRDDGATPAASH